MPRGRYSLYDPYDHSPLGEEHFHCAPGAAGWRYTAQTTDTEGEHAGSIDLTIDHLGRPIRLEAHAGGWQFRGAALEGLTWVRSDPSGVEAQEGNAAAHAFAGSSPAYLVAMARMLRLTPGGEATRVRLVTLSRPVLAPRTIDQAWRLLGSEVHETDAGPLEVENYEVSDLETGETGIVHLAGDVVLAAPGVELEELETPPSRFESQG